MRRAKRGRLGAALGYLALAQITDMDGTVARALGAVTDFGAVADPVADGMLRLQTARILAPMIHPLAAAVSLVAEGYCAKLNAVHNDRKNPRVPFGAKAGTAVQGVGASLVVLGELKKRPPIKHAGSALVATGSGLRAASYHRLFGK